ncbi:MAG: cupin domain-containing protein [Bacteroidetes bacterium]|nr:cupin domain-containing protein [Bacteroidota bacterium]MBU1719999.1 cupin domain-containing protein [Bacteroidota bacterium]
MDPIPKHADERGFLIEFLREDEQFLNFIGQIYLATFRPGDVRGNHYHNHKTEVFTVVKGKMKFLLQHISGGEIREVVIDSNMETLDRIVVEPGYAHTFINTGGEEAILLAWGDQTHDHSGPDQHHFVIQK